MTTCEEFRRAWEQGAESESKETLDNMLSHLQACAACLQAVDAEIQDAFATMADVVAVAEDLGKEGNE